VKQEKILEIISEIGRFDFRFFDGLRDGENDSFWRGEKQRLRSSLYYLEKQGLIRGRRAEPSGSRFWEITARGRLRQKRRKLEGSRAERLVLREARVVIFDIPEKERWKRRWLRTSLAALGFRMVQRSVFVGRGKISRRFLNKLADLAILPYVKIFNLEPDETPGKKLFLSFAILTFGFFSQTFDCLPDFLSQCDILGFGI